MTGTTFVADDIARAGQQMQAASEKIKVIASSITPPDTAMYGLLVSEAAKMTEPQASEQHKEFLDALTDTVAEAARKLGDAARQYQETEDQNASLGGTIPGLDEALNDGSPQDPPRYWRPTPVGEGRPLPSDGSPAPGSGWYTGGGSPQAPPLAGSRDAPRLPQNPEPGRVYPTSMPSNQEPR